MRRSLLWMFLALLGLAYTGCGNKATAPPPLAAIPAGTSYNFLANIGTYDYPGNNCWCYCSDTPPVNGTYDAPTGVAVSGNVVFVADSQTGWITEYNLNGNVILTFYANGAGECNDYPIGLAVDNNGYLYVANADYGEIDVYNFSGSYEGYVNPGDSTLDCPTAVSVDSNGYVYVADPCNGEIFKFNAFNCCGSSLVTSTGSGNSSIDGGSLDFPNGIAVDPSGTHVYVADLDNSVVQVYDGNLNSTGVIGTNACGTNTGCPTTITGQLYEPLAVALDNDGDLLVADTEDWDGFGRIEKFSTSGTFLTEFGQNTTGSPIWATGQLYAPAGIAVDSGNNVYVADWGWDLVFKYGTN